MAPARPFAVLAACVVLVFAGAAAAQSAAPASRSDAAFMKEAAQGGLAVVRGSKIAVDKALNTQVRGYAQQMVDDHTRANGQLKALAERKGVELPDEPTLGQKARLELLSAADGAAFDRRYAETFGLSAHRDAVHLYQKAAAGADDPDVKAYAAKTLLTLQHHLQMAAELKMVTVQEGNAKALHDRKQ